MDTSDWRDDLKISFDDLKVIEKCRAEAIEQFDQFCDYVVEPAFEALAEEFKEYQIKMKTWKSPGKSIHLEIRFPRSRIDQFHYVLWMPKNAVELKLKLTTRVRKSRFSPLEEKSVPFIENVTPKEILKLDKESLAQDVVARYKKLLYETAVISG